MKKRIPYDKGSTLVYFLRHKLNFPHRSPPYLGRSKLLGEAVESYRSNKKDELVAPPKMWACDIAEILVVHGFLHGKYISWIFENDFYAAVLKDYKKIKATWSSDDYLDRSIQQSDDSWFNQSPASLGFGQHLRY